MKKIIKNKVYDTETAKEWGSYNNNVPNTDHDYFVEYLYEKRTGEFFLYYYGGAMSCYGIKYGDDRYSGSCGIRPLSYEQAKFWAEKYLDSSTYEEIFGEVNEDDEKVYKRYCISKTAAEKLKRAAAAEEKMPSEYLEEILMKL